MWRRIVCLLLVCTLFSACASGVHAPSPRLIKEDQLAAVMRTLIPSGVEVWKHRYALRDITILPIFFTFENNEETITQEDRQLTRITARRLPRKVNNITLTVLEEERLDRIIKELKRLEGPLFEGILDQGKLALANVLLIGTTFLGDKSPPLVELRLVETETRKDLGPGDKMMLSSTPSWCKRNKGWCWVLGAAGVLVAGAITCVALDCFGGDDASGEDARITVPPLP